ncbi:chorismate--pyruvate lyase family protein [Paraburkholderia phenoliruptrix]|uniref:chorismate--pyruvate lyase family protein n=1 Tax=Paraburkholderia phenoliruptrix TaxID=252970 RepID=UPI002869DBA5|nr:chorismate lyase [Paraburkholderia phenoliruptrix]WMY09559.1 chorismate lyase [Paraburkholderia phenoliruptrix]
MQWLRQGGSLTRALQALGKVEVKVNFEGIVCRPASEIRLRTGYIAAGRNACRPVEHGSPVWVRDITLTVDAEAVVAARSFVSARDSRASWKSLRTLAAAPLASLLYNDPAVSRSKFAYASFLLSATPFVDRDFVGDIKQCDRAWARISEFRRGQSPLVLTEVFLPALWSVIDQKRQVIQVTAVPALRA